MLGHSISISGADRGLRLAAALACALALGGCGGVEFQGKVFDYMGISGDRTQADPHMTERAPLLVPQTVRQLPQPGQGVAVATARPDWPTDPEKMRKQADSAKKAKEAKAEAEADPLNPYAGKPTLLDKLLARNKPDQEPIADVPEPDPSDARPQDGAVASAPQKGLKPHQSEAPLPQDALTPSTPDSYGQVSNPTGTGGPSTLY
jgi:hypothetical protein